ncbi:MAG TPA: metal-dependent transcriptional regulator [Thermoanaerobaculia bacterium]|nr:metal-dependent transcriptional regulator [Thermoanaerobaculia bacterium]
MPTSTVEDYLKHILLAEQEAPGERVGTGQIASRLALSPGTVTAMLKALADGGLLDYEPYGGVRLTKAGRQLATHVLRRHRLLELFLVEVLGLDWSEVHAEAEQLEHAVSDRLIARMDEMLGSPTVDPHGDPIPTPEGAITVRHLESLLTCPLNTPLTVTRIADQDPAFLRFIEKNDLKPGQPIEVETRDAAADSVLLRGKDRRAITIGARAASKLLVEVD